jgi:hypothetical protein
MERVRQRLIKHLHWYLMTLGVGSSNEDETLREALIESVVSRADPYGFPCSLESFHEANLPFYKEQGFRIEGGGRVPGCGANFWAMMRSPRQYNL